jgi:hypothetical protein
MGDVIQFLSKSERERLRLIQEARERYESIFPSVGAANEQRHGLPIGRAIGAANVRNVDNAQL